MHSLLFSSKIDAISLMIMFGMFILALLKK
ncbi:putative holin-like toxin [Paenibacillus farraposensis]|uniref:Holin-like toxin n=1 Tax=Paenibacillus farraposensis TaxID=2807095 RepID=A0ABW4DHZ4_9BACL